MSLIELKVVTVIGTPIRKQRFWVVTVIVNHLGKLEKQKLNFISRERANAVKTGYAFYL